MTSSHSKANKENLTEKEIDEVCIGNEFCRLDCHRNAEHILSNKVGIIKEKLKFNVTEKAQRWSRKAPSQRHILALWSACQTLFKSSKSDALLHFFFSPQYGGAPRGPLHVCGVGGGGRGFFSFFFLNAGVRSIVLVFIAY